MPVNPTLPSPGAGDVWGATLNAAVNAVAAGMNAEETARAAADTALDSRLDTIEGAPVLRTSALGTLVPVGHRVGHGGLSATSTNLNETSRVRHVMAGDGASLALLYAVFANGESLGAATVTIRAAIETAAGTIVPVFFRGARTIAVEPGGWITSDPVGMSFSAGEVVWVRTTRTIASGSAQQVLTTRSADGEGMTATAIADSGTVTAADAGVFAPYGVLALHTTGKAVAVIGDSLGDGLGDTPADNGFIARALGTSFGLLRLTRSGGTVKAFRDPAQVASGGKRRMAWVGSCHAAVCQYGVNDFNAGDSLATVQANNLALWTDLARRKVKVWQTTLTPWTTSTDSWATVEGQTPVSWEANRVAFNEWVRAGAPIDATTKAAVAVGSAGALVAGATGHPLIGYFEIADLAETGRNSGIWRVGYTTDGIHANATGAVALAAGVTIATLAAA